MVITDIGRRNRTLHLYVVTATNLVFEVQTQSQRRDVAQRAIGPGGNYERWGGGEKFLDGEISKTTTISTPSH